jgi:hypothetical protein
MTLRRKQILDFYAGGLLILVLRPIVALLGRLLRRDHELRVKGEICVQKLLGGGSLVSRIPPCWAAAPLAWGAPLARVRRSGPLRGEPAGSSISSS